jgi:hypothetical protein
MTVVAMSRAWLSLSKRIAVGLVRMMVVLARIAVDTRIAVEELARIAVEELARIAVELARIAVELARIAVVALGHIVVRIEVGQLAVVEVAQDIVVQPPG